MPFPSLWPKYPDPRIDPHRRFAGPDAIAPVPDWYLTGFVASIGAAWSELLPTDQVLLYYDNRLVNEMRYFFWRKRPDEPVKFMGDIRIEPVVVENPSDPTEWTESYITRYVPDFTIPVEGGRLLFGGFTVNLFTLTFIFQNMPNPGFFPGTSVMYLLAQSYYDPVPDWAPNWPRQLPCTG